MIRPSIFLLALAALFAPAGSASADQQGVGSPAKADPVSTATTGARCIGASFDDTSAFQAALDSGRTVYAPALGGHCHITHALTMRTPGQILHGDGRARTRLEIGPEFSGAGVFVAATGEPGPIWRDFLVDFAQPDVADRAKLVRYPPAFLARETPRFEIENVGCYAAMTCVDMAGNSGGATISDFQMSAFETGIDIDGSFDTVRIVDPHWYPFGLTTVQQKLFFAQGPDRAIALRVGRADDLVVRGGLFLGGLALYAYMGATGPMFGNITASDFDSASGIVMEAGSLQIAAVTLGLVDAETQAIKLSGGDLAISAAKIYVDAPLRQPAIAQTGGNLTISGSQFATLQRDVTAVAEAGSQSVLVLNGNVFTRLPGRAYAAPTIDLQGGRTIATGNYANDKGAGTGAFMRITNDNPFNRIIGNASPGWPAYSPSRRLGTYMFN